MALSGSISKHITGREYRIEWSAKQSIADNTSTITCVHKLINAATYSLDIYGRSNTCTVGSDSKSFTSPGITTGGGSTINLGTTTHTVKHDDDGSKTVTITGVFNIQATLSGTYYASLTATDTVTLDPIARVSLPTASASSVQMKKSVTITTNRKASSLTHTLSYSFGGATGTIATGVGASYVWTVPDLAAKINNKTSGTCTITCDTYSGSTKVGSKSITITLTVPGATTPTLPSAAKMGDTVKVSVENRGSSNFTHDVTCAIGSYSGTISTGLKQYVNWAIPKSLANYTSNKASAVCTITCVTYNGTAKVGTTTVSMTLTVPDKTEVSLSVSSLNLGASVTVSMPRETDAYTHDLSYSLKASGSSAVAASGDIATGQGTSYAWAVPLNLAKKIPSATGGTLTITCVTRFKNSTVEVGRDTVELSVTVPNNATTKPAMSVVLTPVHSLPEKFAGLYVQGNTRAKATVTAESTYSTIKKYEMTVNGESYSGSAASITSGTLRSAGSFTVKVTVTDARGYFAEWEDTIVVVPYSNPRVIPYSGRSDVVCRRCLADGTISSSGTYLLFQAGRRYSPVMVDGVQLNFCHLRYRFKVSTAETYGSWQNLIARDDVSADEISIAKGADSFSATISYDVQVNVYDDAGFGHTITFVVPTKEVDFHLKKGQAAFGKYSERSKTLELADDWDLYLHGEAVADHVIAQGTSGNWIYRYYQSGIKEAWYTGDFSNVEFTAYGSVFRSPYLLVDPPPSPDGTVTALYLHATGYGNDASIWFGQTAFSSVSYPDKIIVRGFAASAVTQTLRLRVYMLYT